MNNISTEKQPSSVLSWQFLSDYYRGPMGELMLIVHFLFAFQITAIYWAPIDVLEQLPSTSVPGVLMAAIWGIQLLIFVRIQSLLKKQNT